MSPRTGAARVESSPGKPVSQSRSPAQGDSPGQQHSTGSRTLNLYIGLRVVIKTPTPPQIQDLRVRPQSKPPNFYTVWGV